MHYRDTDRNLLITHQGALGDFITTFPILRALRRYFPRIAAICLPQFGRLAVHLGLIDEYFPVDAARFASLYTDRVDPKVVALLTAYDAILLFSLSAILEKSISKTNPGNVFRIPPRPEVGADKNVVEFLTERAGESGLIGTEEKETFCAAVFKAQCSGAPNPGRPSKIIINPGAGSPQKCWPIPNFIQLAAHFKLQGMEPGFLLGPAEQDYRQLLGRQNTGGVTVHPPQRLIDLVSLLKASDAYIGNDSAVTHLAAFLGVATLAIFGPSSPLRWRPFGPRVEIVSAYSDCSPCFEEEKNDCDHLKCLSGITTARVVDAFDRLIAS